MLNLVRLFVYTCFFFFSFPRTGALDVNAGASCVFQPTVYCHGTCTGVAQFQVGVSLF
jgi:hypothetical protein